MGKSDALKTERILLTLPKHWMKRLEALKGLYGALSVQDVVRGIVGGALFPEDSQKKVKTCKEP